MSFEIFPSLLSSFICRGYRSTTSLVPAASSSFFLSRKQIISLARARVCVCECGAFIWRTQKKWRMRCCWVPLNLKWYTLKSPHTLSEFPAWSNFVEWCRLVTHRLSNLQKDSYLKITDAVTRDQLVFIQFYIIEPIRTMLSTWNEADVFA